MVNTATITRPANTTAYATGDVINGNGATTPIQLNLQEDVSEPWVLLTHLISSNASSTPSIDVYFFSDSFTIASDNAAFDPTDDQMKNYFLGKVSHTSWTALTSNKLSSAKPEAPIEIKAGSVADGSYVYVVLVAAGAYTPASGEVITIKADVTRG
jgi:hypothetical protein